MQYSSAPVKFTYAWASGASPTYVRQFPAAAPAVDNGAASEQLGYPPSTFVDPSAGGKPPDGRDENGILQRLSQWAMWFAAGAPILFDSAYAQSIGGYPKGATVTSSTFNYDWMSTVDSNSTNPDAASAAGWTKVYYSNQSISLTGDASGSGATNITVTLATVLTNPGQYNTVTVNGKGLVTGATNVAYLTGNQNISLSGDVDGSGTTSIGTTLVAYGPGATNDLHFGDYYTKVQVDTKGRVQAGGQITGTDIGYILGYTPANKAGDVFTGSVGINNQSNFYVNRQGAADTVGNQTDGLWVSSGTGHGLLSMYTAGTTAAKFGCGTQGDIVEFFSGNSQIGSIYNNPGSGFGIASSSDYRVKVKIKPLELDSGKIIDETPLYSFAYTWDPGTELHGTVAHEAQEVYSHPVTGTKDARKLVTRHSPITGEDGLFKRSKPTTKDGELIQGDILFEEFQEEVDDLQGVDWSKYVPVLMLELKKLRKRVAELEAIKETK